MIDQLVEMGNATWAWFGNDDNRSRAVAIATVVGVLVTLIATLVGVLVVFVRALNSKRQTHHDVSTPRIPTGEVLSMDLHLKLLEKREVQLKDKLAAAHEEEKTQLAAQIADLQKQIANPDASPEETRQSTADLKALLDREANHIGADRINEAKVALEEGDYSLADAIFAEIEARNQLAVQETARAAHGRGEVAEAEIRWHDAYAHYKRAAHLSDDLDHVDAYARLCWRLAKGDEAVRVHEDLTSRIMEAEGPESAAYAEQLNDLALVVQAQGRYPEAEKLFRQALEIGCATIGEGHPDYAAQLNNLARVVDAQGRYSEAEPLFRQALEIGRATIGEAHPDYAIHLNNLGLVVRAQGRHAEAEALFRQALEISRATIGEMHPDYGTQLNNLAGVVELQGRYAEAESLYRQALEIDSKTIGKAHPSYAIRLLNLGTLLGQTGRVAEGRKMLKQALAFLRATLPEDHPHIADAQRQLDALTAP